MGDQYQQPETTNGPSVGIEKVQFKRASPTGSVPTMSPGQVGSIVFPPGSNMAHHMDRDVPIMRSVSSSLTKQHPEFLKSLANTTVHFIFVNDIAATAKSKLSSAESAALNAAGNRSFVVLSGQGKSTNAEIFLDSSLLKRDDAKPLDVYAQLLAEFDRSFRHLTKLQASAPNPDFKKTIKEVNEETLANLKKIAASPQLMEDLFSMSPNSQSLILRQFGNQFLERLREEISRESVTPKQSPPRNAPEPKKVIPQKRKQIA